MFIAVPIASDVKNLVTSLTKDLAKTGADVSWVRPEQIHITLKFLGATESDKIGPIGEALDQVASGLDRFSVSLSGLGGFPSLHNPRVVWIGLNDGGGLLKQLAERVDAALSRVGFEKDSRPFRAHLTLGRLRSQRNVLALIEKIQKTPPPQELGIPVERLILFESQLSPKGATHLIVKEFPLIYSR